MVRAALGAFAAVLLAAPDPAPGGQWQPSHCIALSRSVPGFTHAAVGTSALAPSEVLIRYVAHSTFLIETAAGVTIATDFTGWLGGGRQPTVATMNKAHSSHYTLTPDPSIAHVLHGWGESPDAPADHRLEIEDVIIRNVPTDIRTFGVAEPNGNSIFIFEVAGLCIGHLGHLHHEPSPEQYAVMGRLDIVMAPVDGGYTMPVADMIRVLKRVRARWVIPMHWFGQGNLEVFLAGMADMFRFERAPGPEQVFSLATLPSEPTVLVMLPEPLPPAD